MCGLLPLEGGMMCRGGGVDMEGGDTHVPAVKMVCLASLSC